MTRQYDRLFFEDLYVVAWVLFWYMAVVGFVWFCLRKHHLQSDAKYTVCLAVIAVAAFISLDLRETADHTAAAAVSFGLHLSCMAGSLLFLFFDLLQLRRLEKEEKRGRNRSRMM